MYEPLSRQCLDFISRYGYRYGYPSTFFLPLIAYM